jgi:hypothetical protein
MGWRLRLNGVDQYANNIGILNFVGDLKIIIKDLNYYGSLTADNGLIGTATNNGLVGRNGRTRFEAANSGTDFNSVNPTSNISDLVFERTGSSATLSFDGQSQTLSVSTNDVTLEQMGLWGNFPGNPTAEIEFSSIEVYDSTGSLVHNWDANLSGGTGRHKHSSINIKCHTYSAAQFSS